MGQCALIYNHPSYFGYQKKTIFSAARYNYGASLLDTTFPLLTLTLTHSHTCVRERKMQRHKYIYREASLHRPTIRQTLKLRLLYCACLTFPACVRVHIWPKGLSCNAYVVCSQSHTVPCTPLNDARRQAP